LSVFSTTDSHNGENQGVGIVTWGATERERYAARRGKKSPQLQVLDLVKQHGNLSERAQNNINKIKITNLGRLINDLDVRAKLGIEVKQGEILTRYDDKEVLKGLTKIVEDLALERIKVGDIYNKEDRLKYIGKFQKRELPDTSKPRADLRELGTPAKENDKSQQSSVKRKSKPSSRIRKTLIPRGCILEITPTRINNIYFELKEVNVDSCPNATAVLFRVFIELSLDDFIDSRKLASEGYNVTANSKLKDKLHSVANYFKKNKLMTDSQLQPVRRAASGQDLLGSSLTTMNAYVHSRYVSPPPGDLKTAWDDLQPFIEKIWS